MMIIIWQVEGKIGAVNEGDLDQIIFSSWVLSLLLVYQEQNYVLGR